MTDPLDLPVKRNSTTVENTHGSSERQYTEKQMDVIVGAQAKAVEDIGQIGKDVVGIVKDIVAIAKIREQSVADVTKIEAETNKVVKLVRAEIDRLAQVGNTVRSRGEVAVNIIKELTIAMKELPEGDRYQMVDQIHKIVESALSQDSKGA